jgi:hypothetical protein
MAFALRLFFLSSGVSGVEEVVPFETVADDTMAEEDLCAVCHKRK